MLAEARNVRRDQHIFQVPQGVVYGKWLLCKDVKRGPGNLLCFDGLDERICIDLSTAPHVDQVRGEFHGFKGLCIEDVLGFVG